MMNKITLYADKINKYMMLIIEREREFMKTAVFVL